MSKNYEEQIRDIKRKIKKLEAHLEYLAKLKQLRDDESSDSSGISPKAEK